MKYEPRGGTPKRVPKKRYGAGRETVVRAMTLKEAALMAEMDPNSASAKKNLFAAVEIPYGVPEYLVDGAGNRVKNQKIRVRYLSRADTIAIRKGRDAMWNHRTEERAFLEELKKWIFQNHDHVDGYLDGSPIVPSLELEKLVDGRLAEIEKLWKNAA